MRKRILSIIPAAALALMTMLTFAGCQESSQVLSADESALYKAAAVTKAVTGIEAETEIGIDADAQAEAETDADDADAQIDAEIEAEAESDADAEIDAEAEAEEAEETDVSDTILQFLTGICPPTDNTPDDFDYIHTGGEYAGDCVTEIPGNDGDSVYAVQSGTVIFAEYWSECGYCVKIDHGNGIVTQYCHLSEILVQVGDEVEAGDVIGEVGITGAALYYCAGYCFIISE